MGSGIWLKVMHLRKSGKIRMLDNKPAKLAQKHAILCAADTFFLFWNDPRIFNSLIIFEK
jgi:hypothetical protein